MKKKRPVAEWILILNRLAELLPNDRMHHVTVIGGAAMLLGYGAQRMTEDVDVVMSPETASVIFPAAAVVAAEFELDADWLNDAAMRAALIVKPQPSKLVFQSGTLVLEAPDTAHMLAMKLVAYRRGKDTDDAAMLLRRLVKSGLSTIEDVWTFVGGFMPVAKRVRARYNLEDLWEKTYGP